MSLVFVLLVTACSEQKSTAPAPKSSDKPVADTTQKLPIEFPKDEGVHRDQPIEWWYFNTQLSDTAGGKYAFAYGKFSTGRHLVSFFNKTADTQGGKDYYEEVTAAEGKLDLSSITGKWKETAPFTYNFFYNFEGLTLDLALKSNKKPFLPGSDGFVAMGENGTSYYYALTDLTVSGTLTMGTNRVQVTGKGWMDHQWGKWDWINDFSQWKWYSVQLDNGTDLMLFNIYKDKKLINSHCGYIDTNNEQFHKIPCNLVTRGYYTDASGGKWQKEVDLEFPNLPNTKLTLVSERDLQFMQPQVLWEGSMKAEGVFKGAPVKGMAFGELNRPD